MTTLDDKLLGFKSQNYVSSSESEGDDNDETVSGEEDTNDPIDATDIPAPADFRLEVPKTGPKGVIEDYRRYKQLETEQKKEKENEMKLLAQKFSVSCQSSLDDEREKELLKELELDTDEFIKQYHLKRLLQLKQEQERRLKLSSQRFGKVINLLDKQQFLDAVDKEDPNIVVVVHLYSKDLQSCRTMNGCLQCLAQQYSLVKFCKIVAQDTGISRHFRKEGLPALLVYKGGQVIGNFVKLEDTFGEDFFAVDVESFLIENGTLTEELECQLTSSISCKKEEESDSDLDID
ncbi:phosducin-like protein isoform X2 [Montipora capricornis]|uniref:phosducin-like protein n=1 Tax=Montipora foliosa TaxID=591990 RepID=UPI0035F1468E